MTAFAAGLRTLSILLVLLASPMLWAPMRTSVCISCVESGCRYSSETFYGVLEWRTVSTGDGDETTSVVHGWRLAATIGATVVLGAAARCLWVLARRVRARARPHRTQSFKEAELRRVFS